MKTFEPISNDVGYNVIEMSNEKIKPVSSLDGDNQNWWHSMIMFVKRIKKTKSIISGEGIKIAV